MEHSEAVAVATSKIDSLSVSIFETDRALARAAARHTADILRSTVERRGSARIIVATGNSQFGLIAALADEPEIPWGAVTVFHMDEYVGMPQDHPASFRRWIRERVEKPFGVGTVHYLHGDAPDAQAEADRYEELLRAEPLDLVCLGIGENGHIAFNEPHEANFTDSRWVRVIEIDERSVQQQVGEGHFPDAASVPRIALTLTVPALLAPEAVQAVVPESRKAGAVRSCLNDPISNACPATALRTHPRATLWLDADSAALLSDTGTASHDE